MFSFMAKATSSMTVDQSDDFITTESFKSFSVCFLNIPSGRQVIRM